MGNCCNNSDTPYWAGNCTYELTDQDNVIIVCADYTYYTSYRNYPYRWTVSVNKDNNDEIFKVARKVIDIHPSINGRSETLEFLYKFLSPIFIEYKIDSPYITTSSIISQEYCRSLSKAI